MCLLFTISNWFDIVDRVALYILLITEWFECDIELVRYRTPFVMFTWRLIPGGNLCNIEPVRYCWLLLPCRCFITRSGCPLRYRTSSILQRVFSFLLSILWSLVLCDIDLVRSRGHSEQYLVHGHCFTTVSISLFRQIKCLLGKCYESEQKRGIMPWRQGTLV